MLRVPTDTGAVWVKVVRPSRVDRIVAAHTAFLAAGIPGPALRGWSPEGIVVLDDAEGEAAADVAWDPELLLTDVDRLRARLADVTLDLPARGVFSRREWYAQRAGSSDRAEQVVAGIRRLSDITARGARGLVHGDLHFGQLFLDPQGAICAVIDVDTAGQGLLAEDPAAFLSHACASAVLTTGPHEARVWALADAAMARWGTDPGVRMLAATHLVGHAVGASDAGAPERADTLLHGALAILGEAAPSSIRRR